MANTRLIKHRIKSAGNISQITRAMQMVAASKMKKAQKLALSGRPYAEKIAQVVVEIMARVDPQNHPFLKTNLTGKVLIILISTNKGLCGGLNANLFRHALRYFSAELLRNANFVSIGKKSENFIIKSGFTLAADFSQNGVFTSHVGALMRLISQGFLKSEYQEVYTVYNRFINVLRQEPLVKKILPIGIAEFKQGLENKKPLEYRIEPALDKILEPLLYHYLENVIRDSIWEAEASEHSARMIAMKNATDNANELIEVLTLEYNKARQEKITYEIADIVTARLAVE